MRSLSLPLRTERLVLRPHRPDDAQALLRFQSRPDVARHLLEGPWDIGVARARVAERIPRTGLDTERRALALVLETADDGAVVGDIALWLPDSEELTAEIGWTLGPEHGGRGYATEAARILRVAFEEYGLHRVKAEMDARNDASARLASRLGMRREAHFVRDSRSKGEWTGTFVYGILDDELGVPCAH